MRETCTSGSVRGGDGDIPTYSAFRSPERGEEGGERFGVGERRVRAEELEPAGLVGRDQHLQDQASEQP
jgi:hypothetical protein